MTNPVITNIQRSFEILKEEYSDFTMLDCLAWLSGYFHNDIPELSNLLDYIVDKDVMKKPRSTFDI